MLSVLALDHGLARTVEPPAPESLGPLLRVVVDGRPQPWARHQGGKTTKPFTPARVRSYQDVLRIMTQLQMAGAPLLEGPVNLVVRAYVGIPVAWSRRNTAAALEGLIRPTTIPDLSNYTKLVEDTFNKLVWRDDSQVVSLDGSGKWYSAKPRLEVEVWPAIAADGSPAQRPPR